MTSIARLLKALTLSAGLLAGSLAGAAPTISYSGGVAVGIQDLTVDGLSYNVSFVFGPYNTVFATENPTFLGDAGLANEAADALVAVMDAAPAALIGDPSNCCGVLWVAFADQFQGNLGQFRATQAGYQDATGASWQRYADFVGAKGANGGENNWAFAIFTENTVPEPASLALVGLALVGAGAVRRRRAA